MEALHNPEPEPLLSDEHRRSLEVESGISPNLLKERGYRTVEASEFLRTMGFGREQSETVPGLLIPIWGVCGTVVSYQFRPDDSREKDGKKIKYESLPGVSPRLDVPPTALEGLKDPTVELWITEGAKKADAACSHGLCCASLAGVWNFRRKDERGRSEIIPDLDAIPLKGRRVVVCYDSDVMTKPSVRQALSALSEALRSRGAGVFFVTLPSAPGEKVGLDDYLAKGKTADDLRALISSPTPAVEGAGSKPRSQATEIVEAAVASGLELWQDEGAEPCASFFREGRRENVRFGGSGLKAYLYAEHKRATGKRCTSQALDEALQQLEMEARHEGPRHATALRIWASASEAYLFLADDAWTVVRIDAQGWRALPSSENPPVRFLRSDSARPLPVPTRGGSLDSLRDVLSLSDSGFEFAVAWLLGCFLPKGGLPILLATGEQGSGKSSGCRILRSMVDPNASPLRNLPKDARSIAASVRSGYVLAFDNVSRVSPELSDLLCSVSTGLGIHSHKLYKDAEEMNVPARNPIVLNGIGEIVTRPDLLDRTLPLPFLRIEGTGKRRTDSEIDAAFEAMRPAALGALLDRVSAAYRNLSTLPSDLSLPRHADLGRWVTASEPPDVRGRFLAAMERARAEQSADVVEGDRLASEILRLTQDRGEVEASASEILEMLDERLVRATRPSDWPRNGSGMASRLQRLAPSLLRAGVSVTQCPRRGDGRRWRLEGVRGQEGVTDRDGLPSGGEKPSPHRDSGSGSLDLLVTAGDARDASLVSSPVGEDWEKVA